MAFHNANFKAINLPVGTYTSNELGNGLTASTVHQVFCLQAGTAVITAMGGGTFSWPATAGQSMNVVAGNIVVSSGEFVGFRASFQPNYVQSLRM